MTPQEIEKVKSQAREYLTRQSTFRNETAVERDRRIWESKLRIAQVKQAVKQATKPSVWQKFWSWAVELSDCALDGRTSGLHGIGKMYMTKA